MEQNNIIEALQKALAKGSGSLDDLDNLLDRAKSDIAKAKEAEAAAAAAKKAAEEKEKAERGQKVADMANRILHNEITDDDCAYVINRWAKKNGLEGDGFTGKDLREIVKAIKDARNETNKIVKELDDMVNAFCKTLEDWGDTYSMPRPELKKPVNNKKEPEDVIDRFLKDFGLR